MGQIQSGINQLIGQVGVLAHLSPGLRAKAEAREATRKAEKKAAIQQEAFDTTFAEGVQIGEKIEGLETQLETEGDPISKLRAQGDLRKAKEERQTNYDISADITQQKVETAQELFDLKPTKESYANLASAKRDAKLYSAAAEGNRMIDREEAMRKMREKGMNKVKQNYSFQDLINDVSKAEREGYVNG